MDPLSRPEFLLLLLEQGDRSLEDHTRLFLLITNTTSYPDDALCSFYDASLNTASRALSSEDGPQKDFAAIGEWTLASKGSPLPICHVDNLARSTSDPVPSPPSHRCMERMPEPTTDHYHKERQSHGSPQSWSCRERQNRCKSWRLCPPRGSQPWAV